MRATKKRKLQKSRRRKLRKSRGGTPWWKRNWLNNEVSSKKNHTECIANAAKNANQGDTEVEQQLRVVHHQAYPAVSVSEVACGNANDKMVWSRLGFFYDGPERKRLQQNAISKNYRDKMKIAYKEKYS